MAAFLLAQAEDRGNQLFLTTKSEKVIDACRGAATVGFDVRVFTLVPGGGVRDDGKAEEAEGSSETAASGAGRSQTTGTGMGEAPEAAAPEGGEAAASQVC